VKLLSIKQFLVLEHLYFWQKKKRKFWISREKKNCS